MIGKICPRGKRVGGLLRYLYATGPTQQEGRCRRNPHVDPWLVGFDDPGGLEPAVGESGGGTSAGCSPCWSSRWPRPVSGRRRSRSTTW